MDKDPFTGLLESVEIAAMVRDLADGGLLADE
jgi:hypothetical protein